MPKSLRVQLAPLLSDGPFDVMGARVSFTMRGAGKTQAIRDQSVAAKLIFAARFIRKLRERDEEERTLGHLEGELVLRMPQASPLFFGKRAEAGPLGLTLEPELQESAVVDTSRPRKRRRSLLLDFDAAQFREMSATGNRLRLLLPEDTDQFPFLELEVTLEVASAEEGTRELNDVLDVAVTSTAPPELPLYDLVCVDELGEPLAGVALRLEERGNEHELTTDDNGVVLLPVDEPGVATVELADPTAVRELLRERWNAPREGKRVQPNDTTDVGLVVGDEPLTTVFDSETPWCLSLQPYVQLARTAGSFFDTNKTFLLPSALPGMRELRSIYEENSPGTLLLVGHTDTQGDPGTNDPLSLDRARSVAAYLADEPDFWLAQYERSVPSGRRWGDHEDTLMASALPDFAPKNESPVAWFERTRFGTKPSATDRRQRLVSEYMALDGANVKEAGLDIDIVTHGCGENFPLDDSGEDLDRKAAEGKSDARDRRVELFFFDKVLGVQPRVEDGSNSAKGSKEYPEWRRRAQALRVVKAEGQPKNRHISVILLSNSACVPLANRAFELTVRGGDRVQGTTDADGFFSHGPVPAGDHVLVIDGTQTIVPATLFEVERRRHMVRGHVLGKATL